MRVGTQKFPKKFPAAPSGAANGLNVFDSYFSLPHQSEDSPWIFGDESLPLDSLWPKLLLNTSFLIPVWHDRESLLG